MSEARRVPKLLVLGASGLIGRYVTDDLRARGFHVTGVARRFPISQKHELSDLESSPLAMDSKALASLLRDSEATIVVNCLGVLQDGPGSDTRSVHCDFVERLLQAIHTNGGATRLVQISIPGMAGDDHTAFSRTKREAERLIIASGTSYAILRPGFVIAPAAYGGSAMLRALAALPVALPEREANTPFQPVAIEDIAVTIAWLTARAADREAASVVWDLMQPRPITLGGIIERFRKSFGTASIPRITLPAFLLDFGAKCGDIVSRLGWTPPIRSTSIAELRRGVQGDPSAWMAATGIVPVDLDEAVGSRTATVQDKWFARLFLIKPLVIACLSVFWIASGFIALALSWDAAVAILTSHRVPPALARFMTAGSSLMDMTIGFLISFRRTCAAGLLAGVAVSFGYMIGATILTPDLWIEPLGRWSRPGRPSF
jgi:uncharacterized protein YbjT (DUF2867 family)